MDLLKSIAYPEEVYALLKYKIGKAPSDALNAKTPLSAVLQICYHYLNKTSRSFAAVIQALDVELRDAVCIFYLVLRSLDTVEDDVTIPCDVKTTMLTNFHTYLLDPEWKYMESKEKDRIVLEDFPVISAEFRALHSEFREVISDITRSMGSGMLVYYRQSPDSLEQWDEYCHYVAGLVGIGLSRLFSVSKLEDAAVGTNTKLSNSMGLFLQKTNIIRDYLEDVRQGRHFWPRQVWSKYAEKLIDLAAPEKRQDAVTCMNELIMNALGHIPDVIEYLSRIRNQSVFNFCAIPQVMAVATLERCYNNPKVFTGVVKIRKGETVRMIMMATSIDAVKAIFSHFVSNIQEHASTSDISSVKSQQCLQKAMAVTLSPVKYLARSPYTPVYLSLALLLVIVAWRYLLAFLLLFINIDMTD